uniref:Potassium channel subfamily T member 2-like n=1 Tax=Diabrotica virgifera virgifera TaxID=50390 RepID=A0A6P7FSL4_DIAVI
MALLARENREKEMESVTPLPLPPRYRFRDLILGDWAFNDDGERAIRKMIPVRTFPKAII